MTLLHRLLSFLVTLRRPAWAYAISLGIVLIGASVGQCLMTGPNKPFASNGTVLDSLLNHDGRNYLSIALHGYAYDKSQRSPVAFFPLYPLITRALSVATGWRVPWCLLIVSNVSFLCALAVQERYCCDRYPTAPARLRTYVLLATCMFPMGFYFRMAYSESLFSLVLVLSLWGMHRRWPHFVLALLVGCATGIRPVGLALVPVYCLYAWQSRHKDRLWLSSLASHLPLAVIGLLSFAVFQYAAFGHALAFVQTQDHWSYPMADPASTNKLTALITLRPLWEPFSPDSPRYWRHQADVPQPFLNPGFVNPVVFVGFLLLISLGAVNKILNGRELLLAAGLLAIPYATRAHEMSLASMSRFASVVVVAYPVAAMLMMRLPWWLGALLLALSAVLLCLYSALFAANHPFI